MANQHLVELEKLILNRYCVDSKDMTTGEWLEQNTRLKGKPFSFNRYPFQKEMVNDLHRNLVCIKPSQVGVSEIFQRAALAFITRNRNTKGIYAYPDDDMRKKNVQTRVMPLLDTNKAFNLDSGNEKPIRSIQLLQVAQSFLYMTGSKVGDATSTDADFVYLDEFDLHDMAVASLFSSRLQNSEWKIKKKFSTPTYTEFGVDQEFTASDQMYYLIKCDSCNHWMFPMFTPNFVEIRNLPTDINSLLELDQGMIDTYNLDIENSYVCCERCRSPLDLGRENNRAWVAKYPSRTSLRGRKINPFSVATRPPVDVIAELLDYKLKDNIKGFKNSVLGEGEDSSNARLSEAAIRACIKGSEVPMVRADLPTWVGIDMGHTCHMVVGQGYSLKAVQCVRMESFPLSQLQEKVREVMNTYQVIGGTLDRHPESQAANDVRDLTNGIILPCEYRGTKELNPVKGPDGEILHVQADRTTLLDEVAKAIRQMNIEFAGYGVHQSEITTHLRNMVREENPETPATWVKLDSMDHFFHAIGFMLTAIKMKAYLTLVMDVPQTFIGVAGAGNTGYTADIYGNVSKPSRTPWQEQFLLTGH